MYNHIHNPEANAERVRKQEELNFFNQTKQSMIIPIQSLDCSNPKDEEVEKNKTHVQSQIMI